MVPVVEFVTARRVALVGGGGGLGGASLAGQLAELQFRRVGIYCGGAWRCEVPL